MALEFQILGSTAKDVKGQYQLTLFGSTAKGESVSLNITGFQPYFYVELPQDWTSQQIQDYKGWLLNEAQKSQAHNNSQSQKSQQPPQLTIEKHKSFWDFTNNRLFTFLKIQTHSKKLWTTLRDVCLDKRTSCPIPFKGYTLRVFEANIDPMLRFFHIRKLSPAGWVSIGEDYWEDAHDATTTTTIQAEAEANDIYPAAPHIQLTGAPLRIVSWDIECDSSHGDFPLANKTWRKPAREIVEIPDLREMPWKPISCKIRDAILGNEVKPALSRIYLGPKETTTALGALGTITDADWALIGNDTDAIEKFLNSRLPAPEGDPIIQIGSALYVNGRPVQKDVFVLGTCDPLTEPGAVVHPCRTEGGMIKAWCKWLKTHDSDCMIGHNISGFDMKYLWDRAVATGAVDELAVFSRGTGHKHELKELNLSSSAMGDNTFSMIASEGRLHIDLLPYVRRNAVLDSYKLDAIAAYFMSGDVRDFVYNKDEASATISTKSTKGTVVGRSIVLMDDDNDIIGGKLEVIAVEPKSLAVRITQDARDALDDHPSKPVRWAQAKDDVSPKEIFELHRTGGSTGRAKIAKYCLQDCDLVMELFMKLEVLNNSLAMANVCWVPVDFIFTRGQGIKAESLMFYECREEGQLIPVLKSPPGQQRFGGGGGDADDLTNEIIMDSEDAEGYEGAIVLDPLTGIYDDSDPVGVLDFSSLYPSSEISENMSHDSVVWVKDYTRDGTFVCLKEGSDEYDNLPDWDYLNVEYDILKPDPHDTRQHPDLIRTGVRVCRFAQPKNGQKSTLPKILQKLLSQRKATRKLAEKETDEFKKALLDARQLAYKLTANSLYGQMGSATFKIRRKCIAASTTAHGRSQILFSKACVESVYGPQAGDPRCAAVCVYGDTDSIFIAFRPTDPETGERLRGRAAQEASKALLEEAGHKITGALKSPHDFEFDKLFRSFCLLSKKRYVGDMTEDGLEDGDYHRKSMGIAMKRRDYAPIVKFVYGGAIERILTHTDIVGAFHFVREAIKDMLAGKFPLRRLMMSASLKAEYKLEPRHKVLADRIGVRDPGNKPKSNDRLQFMFVMMPNGKPWPNSTSQGERIETPDYMAEKRLKPDYVFYITNQISTPVAQMFALVVEKLPGVKAHQIAAINRAKKSAEAREKLASELLFGDLIRDAQRDANGQRDLRSFFTCKN